jgi:alpha-N-arabinofuranosidase
MRKADPQVKVTLCGASICERGIGCAEKKGNFFPSEWEPPMPYDLPFAFGSHEDWDGWLLANCADNVDFVSEHTYAYPHLRYDSQKQSFVNSDDPLLTKARRLPNRIGEFFEAWQKYLERMPNLKEKNIKFIFDEWGCRNRLMSGAAQTPGMLTPLAYALFLNEVFRHSDVVQASCATGGMGTVLIDDTGEATGLSAEGLVLKIMANHFTNALPVAVRGNSPQQAAPGTVFVDIPNVPIGSQTFPLDVTAALSNDRKKLIFSVVNATETAQEFSLKVTGIKLRGPGTLRQIAPPSVNSVNVAGQKPAVEIVEHPQDALPDTVQLPPVSISVYEFEIESA